MASSRHGLIFEDLMIKSNFLEHHSNVFNRKTLNLLRKGTNAIFGEFELMNLKKNPEVSKFQILDLRGLFLRQLIIYLHFLGKEKHIDFAKIQLGFC